VLLAISQWLRERENVSRLPWKHKHDKVLGRTVIGPCQNRKVGSSLHLTISTAASYTSPSASCLRRA